MSENPNYYGILPASVRYCKGLTPNAKILYTELTALTNKNGFCHATNKYFAELYSVTDRAISQWFKELSNFGFIEIQIIKNESGTYRRIFLSGMNETSNGGTNKTSTPYEQNFYPKEYYNNNNINVNNINNNIDSVSEIENVKYFFELKQIIELLTEKTNAIYKIPKSKSILLRYGVYKLVKERFEDGATLEDFFKIIEYKFNEWNNTTFMKYLTPETLFRKSNFDKYLTQIQIQPNLTQTNTFNNARNINKSNSESDEMSREEFVARVAEGAKRLLDQRKESNEHDFWLRNSYLKDE